jgi:hypothetical protein
LLFIHELGTDDVPTFLLAFFHLCAICKTKRCQCVYIKDSRVAQGFAFL